MFFGLSLLFVLLFAGGALGRALLMLLMVEIGVVTGLLSIAAIEPCGTVVDACAVC